MKRKNLKFHPSFILLMPVILPLMIIIVVTLYINFVIIDIVKTIFTSGADAIDVWSKYLKEIDKKD